MSATDRLIASPREVLTLAHRSLPPSARRIVRSTRVGYRLATAAYRSLPHFQIIGAQKAGSSSLFNYLIQHPKVGKPLTKEVHYFDLFYELKSLNWYRAHFSLASRGLCCGEASPYYLYHPLVPARVRGVTPQAKLIALLRNPVDRAFSHYQHNARHGEHERETLSFEEALAKEDERLKGQDAGSHNHRHYSYRSRGIYVEQLKRWLSVFPSEQLLVIRSEDLFENPATAYQKVLDFLGLPAFGDVRFEQQNKNPNPARLDPSLEEQLRAFYRPYNKELAELLGRTDFAWDT